MDSEFTETEKFTEKKTSDITVVNILREARQNAAAMT